LFTLIAAIIWLSYAAGMRRLFRRTEAVRGSVARVLRILAWGFVVMRAALAFGDVLVYELKIFASVAKVSAAEKSTMLSAGITDLMNNTAYQLITALPVPLALFGALLLVQRLQKN